MVITEILDTLNQAARSTLAPIIICVGIIIGVRIGLVQFRHFGCAMKNTLGRILGPSKAGKGEVTPSQALATALAATIGIGNIAGVAGAVTIGGPGAVFWLWVSGLVGMGTKYAEAVLSVKYRTRNEKGERIGGPMYYIRAGLDKKGGRMAEIYCIFGALAALGMGCAVQVHSAASAAGAAVTAFFPDADANIAAVSIGLIASILAWSALKGGAKRVGKITERLVPVMAVAYVLGTLAVITANTEKLPEVLEAICTEAFEPTSVVGAAFGKTFSVGICRGVFSNEAGLGSAGMAHACSSERDPVRQGFYGVCEVFIDTVVICTLTALAILTGCADLRFGAPGGSEIVIAAFSGVMGNKAAGLVIACSLLLFALSTVLTWSLYGARCIEFLSGKKHKLLMFLYKVAFIAAAAFGGIFELKTVWSVSEILDAFMALPNIAALIVLSGVVRSETNRYFAKDRLRDHTFFSARA